MDNKPNVLLINTDHWQASLLGSAGHKVIMTPTLDSLADGGIRFSNAYSECPVCIPARRSLMTGTSPRKHGDRVYTDTMNMPDFPTLAETFSNAGYQTNAVGKLHVYPQRNRIGFDDAIITEEARYDFGVVDDYQIWLGEQGYTGQEYSHGMGNNTYYTRPWHLPEEAHPTTWVTNQMIKTIKRKDPTKPAFYYISYMYPHPPLVPLQSYLDMYDLDEIDDSYSGDWSLDEYYPLKALQHSSSAYSSKEIKLAKRAFYAQCTHIDHQIRLLIGTLRETNMLDNTIIMFHSDHGDMLFDHKMVAKRVFYENAANVPMILSGKPLEKSRGQIDKRLVCLADVMPTLLDLCNIPVPESVEGISMLGTDKREMLYGEMGEGDKATRMVVDGKYKLIYYAVGNVMQLFDLDNDPYEKVNIINTETILDIQKSLTDFLIVNLYKEDLNWISDGKLTGLPNKDFNPPADYALYNQRGGHWPPPSGYKTLGKNL